MIHVGDSKRHSCSRTASSRRRTSIRSQEERFEILRGSVGFKIGRKKLVAGPGQRLSVPASTPHKFWNAGEDEAHFVCEVRPALQFEQLIETMFSLAADDKTNRKGMPNLLRLAVIANAHFDTVQLPFPPAFMQRVGLALGPRSDGSAGTARPTSRPRRARSRRTSHEAVHASRAPLPRGRVPGPAAACRSRQRRSVGRTARAASPVPRLTSTSRGDRARPGCGLLVTIAECATSSSIAGGSSGT